MVPTSPKPPQSGAESDSLTPRELKAAFERGDRFVLLDVREPKERDLCLIAGRDSIKDLHIPMREIPDSLDAIREASGCGLLVVVYCHHGVRSRMAAGWLSSQGLQNVKSLDIGIDAWSQEIDPTVRRY
jgi:rhodanese-related sulfurtransferase